MSVSWKGALAAVAAAAVLVGGVDVVTYAATGDSLILGRTNASHRTTELIKRGPGPALSLKTRGNKEPSLRVSSDAKVRRLNADKLDGRHAWQLDTKAVSYRVGEMGDVLPGVGAWSLKAAPGAYQVTFKVLATPDSAPESVSGMICGVLDLNSLGESPNVYVADSGNLLDGGGGIPIAMSGAEMVRIKGTENPALYCSSNGPDFTLFAASVSLTRINARTVKNTEPAPSPVAKGLVGSAAR